MSYQLASEIIGALNFTSFDTGSFNVFYKDMFTIYLLIVARYISVYFQNFDAAASVRIHL